jgi:hypothetical protein
LEIRLQDLQTQSNRDRRELGKHFDLLGKPLAWMDKGFRIFYFLKNNPLLWTSAFALIAHYKPKLAREVLAGLGALKLLKNALKLI